MTSKKEIGLLCTFHKFFYLVIKIFKYYLDNLIISFIIHFTLNYVHIIGGGRGMQVKGEGNFRDTWNTLVYHYLNLARICYNFGAFTKD